jgi:hypothetical protein
MGFSKPREAQMITGSHAKILLAGSMLSWFAATAAANALEGKVLGGGQPITNSTVTLWAAGESAPRQLGQGRTGADGSFTINSTGQTGAASLYLIAKGGQPQANAQGGDNPAIVLMTVIGGNPPATVTINEMTTVASVWTHAQFLDGPTVKGPSLSLRIAAGNVPNFVDLQTGGWGTTIQDSLNGGQTTTMANFATLSNLLAGCVTRVTADACPKLYTASAPPKGDAPNDILTAAQNIARHPWYQPERLFALLDSFYPMPPIKMDGQPRRPNMRAVPFMPYLNWAPSAWVLPLKFDGGGYRAGGKGMFDSEGNLWVGDNFTIGWQGQDALWQGNATKFASNGKPLSPITTGFTGGGMQGGTFGTAVDAHDNAWFTTYGGHSIAVFDKNGKPLTPPDGITFDGRLGLMQGIIVTPSGDVWALGASKSQLVHFPKGDLTKGRIVCEGDAQEPCKSFVVISQSTSRTVSGWPMPLPPT